MARKIGHLGILPILCTLCVAVSAAAQSSIDVIGLDGRKTTVALEGLERSTVITADAAGIKTTHQGVQMRDVLAKAGVPMGSGMKGRGLARVVIATAADDYQVAFAIAEVEADFNDHVILVADTRDGKPLLPDTGPLQLIVPQDKRAARWIRQVTTLEVRQLP
jgi:hypothetical protein